MLMNEKWKKSVGEEKTFAAQTFDCFSDDLIIAKLNAYGFSSQPLD